MENNSRRTQVKGDSFNGFSESSIVDSSLIQARILTKNRLILNLDMVKQANPVNLSFW